MAGHSDEDPRDVAHTATVAGPSARRVGEPTPERTAADIESAQHDLAELPVVDPETYVFGHYFARGGMGRIAAVRDKRLGRVVAIKELIASEPLLIERFKREIRITAQLQHPAIVSIHEAGRWPTGEPFFAMKRVAGTSLKDAIEARKTLDERLGLVASVIAIVDALAYAHDHGIIHRDLKPANVLVGEFGETVVIDWGLAKDLRGDDDRDPLPSLAQATAEHMTVAGSVLGTPAYMAPEQARGEAVDERTDVYALGVILYTVLAGAPPYDGATQAAILDRVLSEPPAPIGTRQPAVPDDLQAIVARAMAREPDERYPSAKELAADLKRFQTGQLVAAHKYSRGELVLRWLRRHRGAVVVGLGAVVALIALGTASFLGIVRERDRARAAERDASARADALVIAQASTTVETEPLQALRSLAELPPGSSQWPAARLIAADAVARGVPRRFADAATGTDDFAVSPDGRLLAVGGLDHQLVVVDVATGVARRLGAHADRISDVVFSPDGARIATASLDNTVVVWSVAGDRLRTLRGHDGWVFGVTFSPDGTHVISTGLDKTTRVWGPTDADVRVFPAWLRGVSRDGRWVAGVMPGGKAAVWDTTTGARKVEVAGELAALSPDGAVLATVEQDRSIRLHPIATGTSRVLGEAPDPISEMVQSRDGRLIVAGTEAGAVQVWDLGDGTSWTYRGVGAIAGLELAPDAAWIAAWSKDGEVHLIETRARSGRALAGSAGAAAFAPGGTRVITRDPHKHFLDWPTTAGGADVIPAVAQARAVAVSTDGHRLAFGGPGRSLRLWTAPTGETVDLEGHEGAVASAAFSPNGALVASLGADRRVRLWESSSGRGVTLPGSALLALAFSPDGNHLAAPGNDETIQVWDVATGARQALRGHHGWVAAVAFTPDSARAISAGSDGTVRSWDLTTGAGDVIGTHDAAVIAIAVSPDGSRLASGGRDGTTRIWPLSGAATGAVLRGHTGWVTAVAFAPDGRTLASAGSDKTVRLWNVATGAGRVLGSHADAVLHVGFSPDGATLASTSADGTARLWDVATGDHRSLRGHTSWVRDAVFFPDGARLATLGHDGTVRIWADDLPRDPTALRDWLRRATE